MARVLMLLPDRDFDPSEAAVPWLELTRRGHEVRFGTPGGRKASADPRMLHGTGLGPFKKWCQGPFLETNKGDELVRMAGKACITEKDLRAGPGS